jgi:hypothetical protein
VAACVRPRLFSTPYADFSVIVICTSFLQLKICDQHAVSIHVWLAFLHCEMVTPCNSLNLTRDKHLGI